MISSVQAKIATIDKWLTDNKLSDTNILPLLNIDISTEKDEKRLSTLSLEIKNINENNKKISKNNDLISMLKEVDLAKAEADAPGEKVPTAEHKEALYVLKAKRLQAVKALEKIVKLKTSCHVCEQPINEEFRSNLINTEISQRDDCDIEIEVLEGVIEGANFHNTRVQKALDLETKWKELFRSIDRGLPTMYVAESDLQVEVENLSIKLRVKRDEIRILTDQNTDITKRNTRIQVIQEQTQNFITQLGEATKTLNQHAKLDANLEVLKKSFSTNGLLAYKIENLVVELEDVANTYLAELSDGRFTLGFNVEKDKLNVEITDNGNTVDILALSSGELARVNTATLIAIRKLMSSISKSKINILFLDEVINVLDEVGREKMVELLIKEDELNTYIVSHGWTHPLLDKIEVVKDGNVSKLEW